MQGSSKCGGLRQVGRPRPPQVRAYEGLPAGGASGAGKPGGVPEMVQGWHQGLACFWNDPRVGQRVGRGAREHTSAWGGPGREVAAASWPGTLGTISVADTPGVWEMGVGRTAGLAVPVPAESRAWQLAEVSSRPWPHVSPVPIWVTRASMTPWALEPGWPCRIHWHLCPSATSQRGCGEVGLFADPSPPRVPHPVCGHQASAVCCPGAWIRKGKEVGA